jgi:hypothetical protein
MRYAGTLALILSRRNRINLLVPFSVVLLVEAPITPCTNHPHNIHDTARQYNRPY